MADDIVQQLHDWQHIVDESKGDAVVVMLSGRVFGDAADEIERLRDKVQDLRMLAQQDATEMERLFDANKRLYIDLEEAVTAIRYALAHSPRWEDTCDTVLADWEERHG